MAEKQESLRILSENEYELKFQTNIQNSFFIEDNQKIALLVTNEYEGFFKNGGIGTYYRNLSENLASEGWYIILLLCNKEVNLAENPQLSHIKNVFTIYEIQEILTLQPIHFDILAATKSNSIDYQSFCCLFFTQALVNTFQNYQIYIEFHEWLGLGYRTIQAKESNLLGNKCTTGVTLHSGHEWLYEVNETYTPTNSLDFLQVCHYEQYSYENADLPFFPSYYLQSKVSSYGWNVSHAIHMPNFIPIIESFQKKQSHLNGALEKLAANSIPIIFFGRLEERKGLSEFLEAISLLEDSLTNQIHIIFLGKIVQLQSSKLKHLTSQEYIAEKIGKHHIRYDIFSDLSSQEALNLVSSLHHPIVCLTSSQENFPNSTLEVGQLPVRLIVSDIDGFRETLNLINRFSEVYWFQPKNSYSLYTQIVKLLSTNSEVIEVPDKNILIKTNQNLIKRKLYHIEQSYTEGAIVTNTNPKVTIGVTCYNLGKYLMECLTSVDKQTYQNLEVFVLNDASTDEYTNEIFKQCQSIFTNYSFISLEKNIGLGAARNYLINRATGDYFLPLDADNVLLPFGIEKFVSAAQSSEATITTCIKKDFDLSSGYYIFTGGYIPSVLRTNICGDACSLFSINFLRKFTHPEDKEVRTHDWGLMAAAVATKEKITYYPYPLYEYRIRPDSMIRGAVEEQQQYYLRQYLSQIPPSEWSPRQIYMLLTATQQLLQSTKVQDERQQNLVAKFKELEFQLQQSRERIAAMETSKFWRLRTLWLKIKRKLGLPTNES